MFEKDRHRVALPRSPGALGLTAVPIPDATWEEERRLLRRRLDPQACAIHAAVLETQAHGRGFTSLASAFSRLSSDLSTEDFFAASGGGEPSGA